MKDNLPDQKEYKKYNYKLTPFKLCVLQNFPFIEADFDAITNYQLLCKVVEYLNHVIDNQNTVEDNFKIMADNLNTLYNFLDTLDLQDEVNNKLDEMAESGTLQEIISDYLNSKAIFGFDNVESMKNATNLLNGSYAKTLGYYNKNDGGAGLYKIRNITNDDIVDNKFIIEMNDDNLIGELIIINEIVNVKQIGAKGNGIDDDTSYIQSALDKKYEIYVPNGTYLVSSLTLKSGNKLVGESWYSSIIKSINNNTENAIITTIDGAMRVQIIDLAIDGNRENNTNEIDGIHLYKTSSGNDTHSYIHNVRCYQCTGNGIHLSRQLETRINHCVCNNNSKNGIIHEGSDTTIEDCVCSSNYEIGILVTAGANRIINNKCFYNGFKPNTEYSERYSGFKIFSANNSIIGCHAQENAGHGFELINANEITMNGCCADNNGLYLDENRQVIPLPIGTNPLYDGVNGNNVRRSYIECTGRNLHLTNGASQRYTLNLLTGGKNTFVVSSGNQLIDDINLGESTETSGISNGLRMQTPMDINYRFLTVTSTLGTLSVDPDFPLKIKNENGFIHVYGGVKFENELLASHNEIGIIKIINDKNYNTENLNISVVAYPTSLYSNPIGLINGRMVTDGSIKIRNRGTDRGIKAIYLDFIYRPIKQNIF